MSEQWLALHTVVVRGGGGVLVRRLLSISAKYVVQYGRHGHHSTTPGAWAGPAYVVESDSVDSGPSDVQKIKALLEH